MFLSSIKSIELFNHAVDEERKKFEQQKEKYQWNYTEFKKEFAEYVQVSIVNAHFAVTITFNTERLETMYDHVAISNIKTIYDCATMMEKLDNEEFDKAWEQLLEN